MDFANLSQFKNRNVELFRSSDLHNTAIYFTKVSEENRENAKAFFELLLFGLDGDHQIYIRFPNTDHFVEMVGGLGSAHGNMRLAGGKNVWEKSSNMTFDIYYQDNNLLLSMGKGMPEFNFMTKVAEYKKGNFSFPNETTFNYSEIEKALSMQYVKIPQHIRKIAYLYKTNSVSPKYFVVDYPAYNFGYNNHQFHIIDNDGVKEYKIKHFERYRDGGTTIIKVVDDKGTDHTFFSPTPFDKTKSVTWDETNELVEVTDEQEKVKIIESLKLELETVGAEA